MFSQGTRNRGNRCATRLKSAAGVTYTYDGDGRRVAKVGSKLYWYGSGGDILAETDACGNTTAEYIFLGGKRVAMIPWSGANCSSTVAGNPTYYVEDMLGTSRVITTNTGVVCYDADFYPYGGERFYTNTCPQNYKFEGKERDTETGNDDFGARYYSNRFGRWLSADWSAVPVPVPYANLSNPQTLNLYSMVADDPESYADLDGHEAQNDPCGPKSSSDDCAAHNHTGEQKTGCTNATCGDHAATDQNGKDKPQGAGVKAPPTEKPPLPPPPGKGPNGEPNEWVKKPGTDDKPYGPVYEPRFPVPDLPKGSQPRVWWDSRDGWWSHETGKGDPRGHFDRWGNRINAQTAVNVAKVVGTAVVLYRVWRAVQVILEAAALAGAAL